MIHYWCNNESCSEYGKETPDGRTKLAFRDGKMVPVNIPKCPICGKQKFYREDKATEIPNLNIGEFRSMNDAGKKKVLKKRAKELGKNLDVDVKRHFEKKTIKGFIKGVSE